jgi:hypothetical protein
MSASRNSYPWTTLMPQTRTRGCVMELPIVAPAPIVTAHAVVFRDLFENQCQFRHFQHYLTGLIVLPKKTLANMARCILDSADKTNLSRFLAEAPLAGGGGQSSSGSVHAPADEAPSRSPLRVAGRH